VQRWRRANQCRWRAWQLWPRWVWSMPMSCRPAGRAASQGAQSSVQNRRTPHRSKRLSRRTGVSVQRRRTPSRSAGRRRARTPSRAGACRPLLNKTPDLADPDYRRAASCVRRRARELPPAALATPPLPGARRPRQDQTPAAARQTSRRVLRQQRRHVATRHAPTQTQPQSGEAPDNPIWHKDRPDSSPASKEGADAVPRSRAFALADQ